MSSAPREQISEEAAILIVDDDRELCELVALRLSGQGYLAQAAHDRAQALAALARRTPEAVILDLRLGEDDGLDLLVSMLALRPELKVLVLTAHGSIETAVEAMRRGAHSFMTKPFRDRELLDSLAQAIDSARSQPARLAPVTPDAGASQLIGQSAAMQTVRTRIERLAPTDATVLVTGESGTGKELVARSLHELSGRRRGPFVPLNCGALPPELLTSELFGHTKGAFTGATRDREGVFGAARGGTLFLDEIGEAPHEVQVRLLRVLQEQRYTPIGSAREIEADVRVIAATNRDLRAEVAARRFREDLYYRLHVVPLDLPPLRQRREDIPLLAELFLSRGAARHRRPLLRLSSEALELLCNHPLPGNVRQLSHVLEAALLLSRRAEIDPSTLRELLNPGEAEETEARRDPSLEQTSEAASLPVKLGAWLQADELPSYAEVRKEFERTYLVEVLRRTRGNITAAAKVAGRHRTDFYELLRRHKLTGSSFRSG